MNAGAEIAVLGVGSSHGDDQIGWKVVDALQNIAIDGVALVKIKNPIDAIDWLGQISRIHLVDAAIGLPESQFVWQCHYESQDERLSIGMADVRTTHGFEIETTLRLAASLGLPTADVSIWLARAESFAPFSDLSAIGQQSLTKCVALLARELENA